MTQRFEYMDYLSPQNRMKARFAAWATAVLEQAYDLFRLADAMVAGSDLETAVGTQLDLIGALARVPRPVGTGDEAYREYLRAQIAVRNWDGTNEGLAETLAFAFPGKNARLIDNMDGTVTAALEGAVPGFDLAEVFPLPAGVRFKE